MKTVFLLAWLGLLLVLPLRAEDWTTTDGKTYRNVQVLSHNAAYVTILHEDGGGQIPLSTLSPGLQKRFGYDPAQAAAAIAAMKLADQRNQAALAAEKVRIQAADARRQQEAADALEAALFLPPLDQDVAASTNPAPTNPPPPADAAVDESDSTGQPIATEPGTEIDDWGYGDYGLYGGYGLHGYGYTHHGYRSGGWGNHSYGTRSSSPGNASRPVAEPTVQVTPSH
jgi:hypothetical protein